MLSSPSDREPVEQLAEQFAHEQRSGKQPSIDEYAQRYPEHADEIRDLFPALLILEELSPGETQLNVVDTTRVNDAPPEQLGDYQIVREIGRGGMGVVYEARQRSLSRRVALKVLPFHALENVDLRRRFQREAEATARLDHPHIVPVYEVGEHECCPFFSMKFVEGPTLLELLAGGPLLPRNAVEILVPIAQAIAVAHRAGVLHRDLKPSNILLTTDGQPLVADFGLAKIFQPGDAASYTQAMIGTPSYMAPEQAGARGAQVTAATDVYGLGAVLYHMLTGRPPFQAATALDALRQVTHQEPAPPRQLNSTITRDLETICLKCLAKEPQRRYPGASALVDDLQRYLEGTPILARRLSVFARGVRWCQRHPMRAVALGMLLVTCVVSFAAYLVTSRALTQSEHSHQQTREVVDYYLRRVSEDPRFDQHGLEPLRRDLLQAAQEHYQRFLAQRGDDASLGAEIADMHFRLGLINEQIDTLPAAMASYEKAERMQRDLAARSPDSSALAALGKTLAAMGRVSFRGGKLDDARAYYAESLEIRQKLVQQDDDFEHQRLLANAQMNLGLVDKEEGDFDGAWKQFDKAETLRRTVLKTPKGNVLLRRDLGKGLINTAGLNLETIKRDSESVSADRRAALLDEAEKDIEEASKLFEQLVREEPDNPEHQLHLAICWRTLADIKTREGPEAALAWYAQAVPQLEDLVLASPQVLDYQRVLSGAYMNLAQAEFRNRRTEEAVERFQHARRAYQVLLRAEDFDEHRFQLALCERSIGELEAARKNFRLARTYLSRSYETFTELVGQFPDHEEYAKQREACGKALSAVDHFLAKQAVPADG